MDVEALMERTQVDVVAADARVQVGSSSLKRLRDKMSSQSTRKSSGSILVRHRAHFSTVHSVTLSSPIGSMPNLSSSNGVSTLFPKRDQINAGQYPFYPFEINQKWEKVLP
ncbi:hypothetical protein PVK06_008419 [Gossypium arboreum]|uniref:Uncharacterized protein n=1 Tax=Gossypium arboreum TaxID=29729 RepID=A0ABR0QK39_GOSAR|nr:hypothetical protein PVK06_008419 [Gossypium arboreum]